MKGKYIIGGGVFLTLLLMAKKSRAEVSYNYDNITPGYLGKYFSVDEFTSSNTCESQGIDNTPTPKHTANAMALVREILDPIREYIGRPVVVTSFYRSPQCNAAIGGARESKHMLGKAADIQVFVNGQRRNDLILSAVKNLDLPFDRLIREKGSWSNPQWIHIEFDADKPISAQRKQYLRIT